MDSIFKALNDPARRTLLDALRQKDGQSLGELQRHLDMSRFGVMKHLNLLEQAGLITTVKRGRFKYHYLNALPLQEVIDRWIEPLIAKPVARRVINLKTQLEGAKTMPAKPDFVMSTFIDCTHDALWDALTRGDLIEQYHFACEKVTGDYVEGGEVHYLRDDGSDMLINRVIRVDPKTRIETDFQPRWSEAPAQTSRCVYIIEPQQSSMKLTIEHYDLGPGQEGIHEGWQRFAAGLKTWLETGKTHRFETEVASA